MNGFYTHSSSAAMPLLGPLFVLVLALLGCISERHLQVVKEMTWQCAPEEREPSDPDAEPVELPDNLVHYNLTLIRADSAEEAYAKALELGRQHDRTWTNADGSHSITRFRGLRDLPVIYEEPADGSELLYEERENLSEKEVLASIGSKDQLSVFEPRPPANK